MQAVSGYIYILAKTGSLVVHPPRARSGLLSVELYASREIPIETGFPFHALAEWQM